MNVVFLVLFMIMVMVGLGIIILPKFIIEESKIDDRNILRDSSRFILSDEVSLLNIQITDITERYFISEILNGETDIRNIDKLPIEDSDYDMHISYITEAIYDSLSQNYIDRLEYYAYRDLKMQIKLTVNKLFMFSLNSIKARKRIQASNDLRQTETFGNKKVSNVVNELIRNGTVMEDILVAVEESDYLAELSETGVSSALPSTMNYINVYNDIKNICIRDDLDMNEIIMNLKMKFKEVSQ